MKIDGDTYQVLELISKGSFDTPEQKLIFMYEDGTNVQQIQILDANDMVDITDDNVFLVDEDGSPVWNTDNIATLGAYGSSSSSSSSSSGP